MRGVTSPSEEIDPMITAERDKVQVNVANTHRLQQRATEPSTRPFTDINVYNAAVYQ